MSARGKFITLEGIDGAGKSSHLAFLCERVRGLGHEAVLTREPGGTPAGEHLREFVLHHPMDALAEALLMFAARRVHVRDVIAPALASGRWVVCDRFSDSTFAYQCGGRGLPEASFTALEGLVHPELQPDATFLFDLDPAVAYDRQRAQSRTPDKFEREEAQFFVRVREAYLARARANPARVHAIDASGDLQTVRSRLAERFEALFP